MAKISMKISVTVAETFEDFLLSRKAKGLSEKTLATYKQHFSAISKHLSPDIPTDELSKEDLERMIAGMRDAELSSNSIRSYTRTLLKSAILLSPKLFNSVFFVFYPNRFG